MFGTYERYNLIRAAFARHGSNTYIVDDFHRPGTLRLGNNWAAEAVSFTDYLFDLKLLVNGEPVKYTYFADEGSITLSADCCATVEIALTDRAHFRVRGENAGLRMELRSAAGNGAKACRGAYALPDGSGWEADFGRNGKLFPRALCGNYAVTDIYDDEANQQSLLRIDFMPDAMTGTFEAAVHDYRDGIVPYGEYEDFDDLVEDNRADFAEFREVYDDPAQGYEELAKYAEWVVWSHRTKAAGCFKEPSILFQNTFSTVAAPWQQSYNAMPMLADPDEAWRLVNVYFNYQDESTGKLPGMMSFTYPGGAGIQPAFQGFALDYIFRNIGDDFITQEEAERVYPKMAAWTDFWTKYRNAGFGNDLLAINNAGESGWDDASLFRDGFPVIDPCANSFIILQMEAVARIAKKSVTYADRYGEWMERAKKLTAALLKECWDGEKFVSKVKGKPVESHGLANYQPIILGKRLPQDVIDKIAEKLVEKDYLLTEIGLASESLQSDLTTYASLSYVCGRVVGPMNMILTVGLQSAGKRKEAEKIARLYCDHANREGVILGYAPYNFYKHNGEVAVQQIPPHGADGWPWSSWSANCILTMITGVIGK